MSGHRYGSPEAVRSTLALLRWYRDFIASDYEEAHDPEGVLGAPAVIGKEYARARLSWLIHVAINRKAGLWPQGVEYRPAWTRWPRNRGSHEARDARTFLSSGYGPLNHHGAPARRADVEHYCRLRRDQQRLRDIHGRRVRVYYFESAEVQGRFRHLLANRNG